MTETVDPVRAYNLANKVGLFLGLGDPRIMDKIDLPDNLDDCWEWKGTFFSTGYARDTTRRTGSKRIHVILRTEMVGEVKEGFCLDHRCNNKRCVNPYHLDEVTPSQNSRRHFAQQTHCKRGHEFNEDNTRYTLKDGLRIRICRVCQREALRKSRARYRR